ncbi:hypothetical protein [Prescottella equi]|uniref:hypothetical protein n=1 Tax=Rhodococcus hoagii TaxID=43767 RepID=UPI0007CD9418|nr:hypothetical protein [Prescottella equi]BDE61533.1 hypothetical protein REA19_45490 [Prescottella equi]
MHGVHERRDVDAGEELAGGQLKLDPGDVGPVQGRGGRGGGADLHTACEQGARRDGDGGGLRGAAAEGGGGSRGYDVVCAVVIGHREYLICGLWSVPMDGDLGSFVTEK